MFTKSFGSLDARQIYSFAHSSRRTSLYSTLTSAHILTPHLLNLLTASHLPSWSTTPSHRRNVLETKMATSSLGVMFTKSMFNVSCSSSFTEANKYVSVNLATLDDHPKNQDHSAREEMLDTIMLAHEHGLEHQQSARTPMLLSLVDYSHSNNRRPRKHTACPSHHHHPVLTIHGSKQRRSQPNAYSMGTKTRTTSGR